MMSAVIKVEHIGKKYRLDHLAKKEEDLFIKSAKNQIKNLLKKRKEVEEFWALKDVSFEIQKGDRVGIIGRNGAGKSTLLKILSRIVTPTTGRIEYEGQIASLLEVGTGFHGDLTGRENIYLNGSILGMSKQEITKKFDEIVDFSEVEQFLDTPV
ncbi:MAG: ABC transporter ATP-binding protein, partial [Bacteroidia bacterium]